MASERSGLGNNSSSPGQQQREDQMSVGPTVSKNGNEGDADKQSSLGEAAMFVRGCVWTSQGTRLNLW